MSEQSQRPRTAKAVRVRPVPAVSRSIAILRFLGSVKQGMGVKAIADELGLVPSTCLHILRVLVSENFVRVDPETKRYSLGSGMISLAKSVLEGGGFARLVQPALDRLASTRGVTAIGVELTPRQTVVVLALAKPNQPFRLHVDVGSETPGLPSATGRLMAACSGETWTQLRKKFNATPWDKAPSFDAWKKEVEEARARGWSVDRDNFVSGITAVAVPVLATNGSLTHTLVALGLSSQMNAAAVSDLVQTMQREARLISDQLFPRA
jgi:DNA-binding IclR family transcriptional regulator